MLLLEQALCLRRRRRVHGNEVGGLQHLLQRAGPDAVLVDGQLLDERVVGDDVHAERLGPRRNRARDVAERDQAEGLAP